MVHFARTVQLPFARNGSSNAPDVVCEGSFVLISQQATYSAMTKRT